MRRGFTDGNGSRHYPASALVCSVTEPITSRPSLLQHSEVRNMFHELGHAIHNLVSRTKYAIAPSRDFVEIPSLFLENWIWEPEVLFNLGKHYTYLENSNTRMEINKHPESEIEGMLPHNLANDIAFTKTLNKAQNMLTQIQRALFDLAIHTPADHKTAIEMDTTTLWNMTKRDIFPLSFGNNLDYFGFGQAAFGHIFRNYDAGYLTYPISSIYAADLYTSFSSKDSLSSPVGRRYRYQVLQPGSSKNERKILEKFLGRKLSSEAFFYEFTIGLEARDRAL